MELEEPVDSCSIQVDDDDLTAVSLKEYLECACCDKKLVVPVLLPCLHSFCMECLKNSHDSQKDKERDRRARIRELERSGRELENDADSGVRQDFSIKGLESHYHSIPVSNAFQDGITYGNRNPLYFYCPIEDCDGVTKVPLGNTTKLSTLKTNGKAVSNIEHTLTMKRDLPERRVPCGSCCNKTAIGVCYNKDCNNQPYCGDCLKFHLRDNKRHAIAYPQQDDDSGNSTVDDHGLNAEATSAKGTQAWNSLKQSDLLCSLEDHERFFRNLYCEDHDEVVCLACTGNGGLHQRCEHILDTSKVYDECITFTRERLQRVEKLHDYFLAAIKTTEEVKRALEIKVDRVKESVTERYSVLKEQLRTHRDDLLKKCKDIFNHKSEELDQHLKLLKQVSQSINHSRCFTAKFIDLAIPSEFMMMKTQLDQRLEGLLGKYSSYRCETTEDDCIFMEENKNLNLEYAIGQVYSTPSVKNFRISAVTNIPKALQPFYLTVVTHDTIGNEIICHTGMPKLCATIRHIDEDDIIEGLVEKERGKYFVMVYPSRTGQHELCIFQPMEAPYSGIHVGTKKYIIHVDV